MKASQNNFTFIKSGLFRPKAYRIRVNNVWGTAEVVFKRDSLMIFGTLFYLIG
jgi:hypothetical protein